MTPPTRRELVQRAMVGTWALSAASAALFPGAALAQAESDLAVVQSLVATELLIVFSYRYVLRSRLLGPASALLASDLATQEQEHVDALSNELRGLSGVPPVLPDSVAAATTALAAGHVTGSLAGLRSEKDCLKLLVGVESLAERAYYKAIGQLNSGALSQLAAQIMANEAQHWTALAERLDPGKIYISVPNPYVEGTDQVY